MREMSPSFLTNVHKRREFSSTCVVNEFTSPSANQET